MFPRARRKFSGRRVQQGSLTGLICRSGMGRWREGGKAGAERRHDYANITGGDCTFVEWRGQAERRQCNVLGGVLEFTCVANMHRSTSSKHTFAVSPPYCRRISSPFIVFSDGANTCRTRTDDGVLCLSLSTALVWLFVWDIEQGVFLNPHLIVSLAEDVVWLLPYSVCLLH